MSTSHIPQQHWDTPSKGGLLGAKSYLVAEGITHSNRRLFRHFGIPETTGRRHLRDHPRRFHNNPFCDETRGRNRILSEDHINKIEKLLWEGGFEARSLPWSSLPREAGCDFEVNYPSAITIQRALSHKDWRKCVACTKAWTTQKHADERIEAANEALKLRPKPEDWEDIRWSDECHFSYGPEGKHKIIRKPGERECPDCIQYQSRPTIESERYRCHCWAAIGYDFKSELTWYTTKSKNGAITMKDYISQILEPVVKPWLDSGAEFILKEDGASGHGSQSNHNIVAQWKKKYKLESYFNVAGSPDLSPIENAWKAPKSYLKEHAIWDEDAIKEAAEDGWENLTEGTINGWVHSMPQRFRDVITAKGQLTGS